MRVLISKDFLDKSEDEFKLHESQIAIVLKEREDVVFVQNACNATVICLQALLCRYQDVFNHVAKCLSDEGVRLEAGRATAANKV